MDCSSGAVTTSDVGAFEVPKLAVSVAVPARRPLARPLLAGSSLTLAKPEASALQVASKVRSWVVKSEKVPVAANCLVKPAWTVGVVVVGGTVEIVMDVNVAFDTVNT
jgi:hypothetical protein